MAISYGIQITFGMWELQELLDPTHELVKLEKIIDWEEIHNALSPYYSNIGRQGLPIRLMVGLHILKHKANMSDEKCADRIRSDLYWMYFCGVDSETLKGCYQHLNSATMTKFRNRIGETGFAHVEEIIRKYLLAKGHIDSRVMNTDSTCQPKNIIYPTDTALLDSGRRLLLKGMKQLQGLGVKPVAGLRTFSRKSKKIILGIIKLSRDRQERIKAGTLELAQQAKHVLNKCKIMIVRAKSKIKTAASQSHKNGKTLISKIQNQVRLLEKIIQQSRQRYRDIHIAKKIYSLHAPEVVVMRKGKSHCPNEYGTKLNISTDVSGFIVHHESYASSIHDSRVLEPALKNWEQVTGRLPNQVNTDRGYNQKRRSKTGRIQKIKHVCTPWNGKKKNPNAAKEWFKRGQRQRSQIEGVFGHLKQDHRLDRCRYKGFAGDKINATLAVTAWNLTKLCTQI